MKFNIYFIIKHKKPITKSKQAIIEYSDDSDSDSDYQPSDSEYESDEYSTDEE